MQIRGALDNVELGDVDAGSVIEHQGVVYIVMDAESLDMDRDTDFVDVCRLSDGWYESIVEDALVKVWRHAELMLEGVTD